MTAVTAPTTSRARARDVPRAIAIAAAGAARLDGSLKHRPIKRALQPAAAAVACVLLNAAVATFGAAVAGELDATAIFVIGRRGPGRTLRSRLSVAAGGVFLLVLMLLPGVTVGLLAASANGDSLQGWIVGMRVTAWGLLVTVVWTVVGLAIQLSRTRAYRQGYRNGVPA